MVKQPTIVNATSHKPTIILLILNLIATIALLAHVVYYIPSSTRGAATATRDSTQDSRAPKDLVTNGIGTIGLDNTNRVRFDLIKLQEAGASPEVVQTVTVTQRDFLDSLERFSRFRDALVEKDLIRRNDDE